MDSEEHRCDVLVVGGGGAGLRAAIEARRSGRSVMMVSKAPAGKSGATAMAAGGFNVAAEGRDSATLYDQLRHVGRYINDVDLLRAMAEEGAQRVRELEAVGLPMIYSDTGARANGALGPYNGGSEFAATLGKWAADVGVQFFDGYMVTDVLIERGVACGVAAFRISDGSYHAFYAAATVLATGGAAAMFAMNDNPRGSTGDGFAIAYRAGLPLRDMEFTQFYPLGMKEPDLPRILLQFFVSDDAPIRNAQGEAFMPAFLAEIGMQDAAQAGKFARDSCSRRLGIEIFEGRGVDDAVLLMLEEAPPAIWETPYWAQLQEKFPKRFHPGARPVRVAPIAHYSVGGIVIDTDGATELEGLYGAGEITAGIDGANRMAGSSLATSLVFGARVGEAASLRAASLRGANVADARGAFERIAARTRGSATRATVATIMARVTALCDAKIGIVRSADSLRAALTELQAIAAETAALQTADPAALRSLVELEHVVLNAQLAAQLALARTESRGTHFRLDHPLEDDGRWMGSLEIRASAGAQRITWHPVATSADERRTAMSVGDSQEAVAGMREDK